MRRNRHAALGRTAFTLLEVVLVLALLIVVTALAWPALERPMAAQQLREAGSQILGVWSKARFAAMTSGRIHVFRYAPDERGYRVEPHSFDPEGSDSGGSSSGGTTGNAAAGTTLAGSTAAPTGDASQEVLKLDGRLPDGLAFMAAPDDPQTTDDVSLLVQTDTTDGNWAAPVFFFPDGTTLTTKVTLKNRFERTLTLSLRGLTGVGTMGDVTSAPEGAK